MKKELNNLIQLVRTDKILKFDQYTQENDLVILHCKVESLIQNLDQLKRSDVNNRNRLIGEDPITGKPISARLGKFGAYVQLGNLDDEEKPKFASLRKGQFLDKITLEDAIELFKLPRIVGSFEEAEIQANVGRYGPYVKHSGKFISLKPLILKSFLMAFVFSDSM